MFLRRRLIRNLQVVAVSILVVGVASLLTGLLWLNKRGFSGEWSATISQELAALGIHAEFEEARFSPLRGIIVTNAVIHLDESPESLLARVPALQLDVDRARALRGELVFRKCRLRDAELFLPLTSDGPDQLKLVLHKLNGTLSVDRQGRLLLEDATGSLGGMTFTLGAELTNFDPKHLGGHTDAESDLARHNFLRGLRDEFDNWHFPPDRAPHLDLQITGDLRRSTTVKTRYELRAQELTRLDYNMEDISLRGQFFRHRATVERFEFSDGAGRITSQVDYDVLRREGRYTFDSSIKLAPMLRSCFKSGVLDAVSTGPPPVVKGDGHFRFAPDGMLTVGTTGELELRHFNFLGMPFEGLEADFSWQDGDIHLRNIHAAHRDGALTGHVLIQEEVIRYEADSSLPISTFNPFLREDSGIRTLIDRTNFSKETRLQLSAKGSIDRRNLREWSSSGKAVFENFAFNGVPLHSATATYAITPLETSITDLAVDFDYTDSPLRRKYGGPARAVVTADRIAHDRVLQQTELENIRGTAWPGTVLRLFLPKVADHIDRSYRFRAPPSFVTDGTVDYSKQDNVTDVRTRLTTSGTADYTLLGRSLSLSSVKADVRYQHRRVDVTDLAFRTFQGRGGGEVGVTIRPGQPSLVGGGMHWTRLRLADLGRTYGFEKAEKGYVTGRLDFSMVAGNIATLKGTGAIGLEQGHLFYVPILGPLSTILSEVAGDKGASHEEARDASCTFAIRRGILYTRDFLTSTPSSVFTGEGSIDLDRKTIDMTLRMNARGLLGLITLPLRPFNGLFQFRGQGPLKNPTWKRANFVPPTNGDNDPIFRTPGKAVPVRER